MRVSGKHNDLDNVGPSLRHHTFFEMLGQLLVRRLLQARRDRDGLDAADRRSGGSIQAGSYATVFKGEAGIPRDDEAYDRWRDFLPEDHVGELGMADNFWAMGDTGPCGRCSEIYYDRGPEVPGTGHFIADVEGGQRALRRDLEQRVHGVRARCAVAR